MLRILPDGSINAVFPKNGAGIDLARTFCVGVSKFLTFRRVAIKPPDLFEVAGIAFFHRVGIESIANTIAAAKKDKLPSVNTAAGRRTPLAVKNVRPDLCIVLSNKFPSFLINSNQAGRIGGRDVGVAPVLSIGGVD